MYVVLCPLAVDDKMKPRKHTTISRKVAVVVHLNSTRQNLFLWTAPYDKSAIIRRSDMELTEVRMKSLIYIARSFNIGSGSSAYRTPIILLLEAYFTLKRIDQTQLGIGLYLRGDRASAPTVI
jgi:hypothetical protein